MLGGGTKVGQGSGDRLSSPAGPGRGRGGGEAPPPGKLLGFEYLGSSVSNFEAFCEV